MRCLTILVIGYETNASEKVFVQDWSFSALGAQRQCKIYTVQCKYDSAQCEWIKRHVIVQIESEALKTSRIAKTLKLLCSGGAVPLIPNPSRDSNSYPWPSAWANAAPVRQNFPPRTCSWRCVPASGRRSSRRTRSCRSPWSRRRRWRPIRRCPEWAAGRPGTSWGGSGGLRRWPSTASRPAARASGARRRWTCWWSAPLNTETISICFWLFFDIFDVISFDQMLNAPYKLPIDMLYLYNISCLAYLRPT